jgi:hypothetical protein
MIDFEPTGSAPRHTEPALLLGPAPSTVISWGDLR